MAMKFTKEISESQLVSYLLDELPPEQQAKVDSWLKDDPGNRLYLDRLKTVWEKTSVEADTSLVNEEVEWERFKDRISGERATKVIHFGWMKIAAAVIVFAAVAYGVVWFNNTGTNSTNKILAGASVKVDTLPDGSVITLNKNATLSYTGSFNKNDREVDLRGEAFFSVAHNKERPFLITAGDVRIKVIGTSFNVKTSSDGTEIIVESGVVQVQKSGGSIELLPGEKVTSLAGKPLLIKETVRDSIYNYYRSNKFECIGTPLWQLVQMLNQAYETRIIVGDEKIRNYPVTGTYTGSKITDIIEVVCRTLNIKSTRKGNEIILY